MLLEQRAQAVGLALAGSVTPRNSSGIRFSSPAAFTAASAASACTSVSGVPPDLEMTMKRAPPRSSNEPAPRPALAVEVVVEARARPLPLRLVGGARDVPAAELGQRLPAQARPAGAEEDDGARALGQPGEGGLGLGDVGGLLGDAQVRQAPGAVVLLQAADGRRQPRRASGRARPRRGRAGRLPCRDSRRSTACREGRYRRAMPEPYRDFSCLSLGEAVGRWGAIGASAYCTDLAVRAGPRRERIGQCPSLRP